MTIRADAESLGRIPLFRGCETVPLQILAFSAERMTFEADDPLFSEGEEPRGAYFIMSGSVGIARNGKVLTVVEEGALLGETSMIGRIPYSITARAQDMVTVARFDQQLFLRVAGEYPDFGKAVLSALGDKLSDTVRDFDRIRVQLGSGRNFSDL
jgi:CRP/FNR family transcriptional regulator, cyclic AMP receptor protein